MIACFTNHCLPLDACCFEGQFFQSIKSRELSGRMNRNDWGSVSSQVRCVTLVQRPKTSGCPCASAVGQVKTSTCTYILCYLFI